MTVKIGSIIKKIILRIVLYVAITFFVLIPFLYFYQDKLLYYPIKQYDTLPNKAYEKVELTSPDGLQITGWFFPLPKAHWTILFCHGNAGNISHRLDTVDNWLDLGCQILLFDYRGYGQSQGKPDEKGTYSDARTFWDWLTQQQKVKPDTILVHGRSLGAAVALQLTLDVPSQPAGLIMESAFLSVPAMAQNLYPFLPVRWLCKHNYDNDKKIGDVTIPKLIIHSSKDELIPFEHGQTLFKLAHEPKYFTQIQGGHNDGFLLSSYVYKKSLKQFLQTGLLGSHRMPTNLGNSQRTQF